MAEGKKKRDSEPKSFWQREASAVLRSYLARQGVGYKALSLQLERIGVKLNARALGNKIARGRFSFSFFLQCLRALGYTEVKFELSRLPEKEQARLNRRPS